MKLVAESQMRDEAHAFAAGLRPAAAHATVVALSGGLGAGKTTFVKGVAEALGVIEPVRSPTFVIMKSYPLAGRPFRRLVHMDAYRLKGAHHLAILGWDELMRDSGALVLLEWPERIGDALPKHARRITLAHDGDGRHIAYG